MVSTFLFKGYHHIYHLPFKEGYLPIWYLLVLNSPVKIGNQIPILGINFEGRWLGADRYIPLMGYLLLAYAMTQWVSRSIQSIPSSPSPTKSEIFTKRRHKSTNTKYYILQCSKEGSQKNKFACFFALRCTTCTCTLGYLARILSKFIIQSGE